LPLDSSCMMDKLNLVGIPDEVLEWATGKRARIPNDTRIIELREFCLVDQGA
jgi:hypothetical protein